MTEQYTDNSEFEDYYDDDPKPIKKESNETKSERELKEEYVKGLKDQTRSLEDKEFMGERTNGIGFEPKEKKDIFKKKYW